MIAALALPGAIGWYAFLAIFLVWVEFVPALRLHPGVARLA